MVPVYYNNLGIEIADEPGKRICIKIDGGPGLTKDPDYLEGLKKKGFVIFPGLPNATSVNQVCMQLYVLVENFFLHSH